SSCSPGATYTCDAASPAPRCTPVVWHAKKTMPPRRMAPAAKAIVLRLVFMAVSSWMNRQARPCRRCSSKLGSLDVWVVGARSTLVRAWSPASMIVVVLLRFFAQIFEHGPGVALGKLLIRHRCHVLPEELARPGMPLQHLFGIQDHVHDVLGCSPLENVPERRPHVPILQLVAGRALGFEDFFPELRELLVDGLETHAGHGTNALLDLLGR